MQSVETLKTKAKVTLESDKATMEIPAPQAGKVVALAVKVGDKISKGGPILSLEPSGVKADAPPAEPAPKAKRAAAAAGSATASCRRRIVLRMTTC